MQALLELHHPVNNRRTGGHVDHTVVEFLEEIAERTGDGGHTDLRDDATDLGHALQDTHLFAGEVGQACDLTVAYIQVDGSARLDADFIYEAFRLGAGGVLFSGCHPQDCHYITGQPVGERRAGRLLKQFERMGMTPGRFRIEWISAAEGDKYARVINEMQELLGSIPQEELLKEIEELRPQMEKRARRMGEVPEVEEALEFADHLTTAMLDREVEVVE